MLGKLLKHEWKAVWKVPTFLIGILMLTAVLAGLTFALPIWDSEWIGLPLSGMMMILLFYFAMIATGLGITIYFAVRYYKNMYTDEGYLTHTLPVSARQLLLNKVITMSAWSLIGGLAVIVSIILFGEVTFLSLASKDSTFARKLAETFAELPRVMAKIWYTPELKGIWNIIENELSERQRQMIVLYYFNRLNIPEIAEMLGVNRSTVSRTISRGRRNILEKMKYFV